ncbi:protein JTB isoform 2-T2 [Leptodactylus fuscus]|uniref:protein JTB isoform X2 n=1 Tax=Leptodactylus fuscus TaxID=238119 RepID=UPI003F4EA1E9
MEGWLLLGAVMVLSAQRLVLSSPPQDQKSPGDSDPPAVIVPCWQTEEYAVSKECYGCSQFEAKTLGQCSVTGFIEKVSCTTSNKSEYKSCRSAPMEKRVFWQFVGIMLAGTVALSLLVISRQRTLDRRALEKVRKQIESI